MSQIDSIIRSFVVAKCGYEVDEKNSDIRKIGKDCYVYAVRTRPGNEDLVFYDYFIVDLYQGALGCDRVMPDELPKDIFQKS